MSDDVKPTPLQYIRDIHQQVREFIERERPWCKVIAIRADSGTDYLLPPMEPINQDTKLELGLVKMSFRVKAIEVIYHPGMQISFDVEIAFDASLQHNEFVIMTERGY